MPTVCSYWIGLLADCTAGWSVAMQQRMEIRIYTHTVCSEPPRCRTAVSGIGTFGSAPWDGLRFLVDLGHAVKL